MSGHHLCNGVLCTHILSGMFINMHGHSFEEQSKYAGYVLEIAMVSNDQAANILNNN